MNDNTPITKSLVEFLKDKDRKVATLKGEWGVGKTFYWRDFLKNHKTLAQDFKAVSYVSLFGIQNLAELKKQVFANSETMNKTNNKKFSKNMKRLNTAVKSLNYLPISVIADIAESKFVEKFLICIDDLERKEGSLTVSSILGYITTLTEEKGCKILLIYNDQKLDKEPSKQINEYREKVVDLELTYQPSMERNLSIVWKDGIPDTVSSVFDTLELNNIRIMQRVQWTLNYFKETFEKYSHLRNSFERNAVILTILHHAFSSDFEIHEVLNMNWMSVSLPHFEKNENDDDNDRDKERFRVLEQLQYYSEKEYRLIVEYLVNGYVNFEAEENFLRQENEQKQLKDVNAELHEIWGKYSLSFVTSQEDFTKALFNFTRDNLDKLWLADVLQSIDFIRTIDDKYSGLNDLLEKSIKLCVNKLEPFESLDQNLEYQLKKYPDAFKQIKEKIYQKATALTLPELFKKVAGSNTWNSNDIAYFRNFSEDEYFSWLTTEESEKVIHLVATFLERLGNNYGDDQGVINTLRRALERIKKRSNLDKIRIEKLIERK